ncbi:MAG TPA: PLP-dependent aminotransferase family protein [Candidatus Udaeobacter sp.]|jgi:GntR family transcriptional regulator / MocR family aminotransferase|nr:PLP-dependent aminotransferase family protein [Candidatus Udaeobacter sp.]
MSTIRIVKRVSAKKLGKKQRRRHSIMAFEMIRLDRAADEPLHEQLYRQIRDELISATFNNNSSRLPSSRDLAVDLGVSRFTVNVAFSRLHSEGYLQSRIGSGTFVAEPLPETFLSARTAKAEPHIERAPRLSDRVRNIPDQRAGKQFDLGIAGPPGVTFVPAVAALDEFPIAIWERLRAQVLAKKGAHLLQYASSRGDPDLRKALATYLCDHRGARCHPDQIIITAGTQQAMMISAMALVNRGEVAWIEDPGFYQARRTLGFAGATVVPRPVDREGITIARPSKQRSPKIIYVTPSHQFPLGMTMSLARRTALIDFARTCDAYIFEDDHNSEFRYTGPPLPCLQGLDNVGRVIYSGTMSKILYPSLRLGYILAPEQLVEPMIKIRAVMDQHSPAIDQATLARFLTEGFFLSHIKRMRKLYSDRREFFIEQFNKFLSKYFRLEVPEAGLHFVAWVRQKEHMPVITRVCTEIGIRPSPLSSCYMKAEPEPALTFGFAAWSRAQIREGLSKFAAALNSKLN